MALTTISTEVKQASEFLRKLSECLSDESTIKQARVLFTIAQAGDGGMDAATLEKKLGMSPASISRTIRVLSTISYDRSEGFGMIEMTLDPSDNRRRIVRINKAGDKAVCAMAAAFSGVSKK
jgi:DNA-binding MarR family transcriptional regulator